MRLPQGNARTFHSERLWGDWLGVVYDDVDVDDQTLVTNIRTGESFTRPGGLLALGDGFALIRTKPQVAPVGVQAWLFATGATVAIPDGFRLATDGNSRVAWVDADSIKIASLPGAGTSAPRLLGVVAPGSLVADGRHRWTPQLDFTKALAAGALELHDATGSLVRSIPTQASESGSLRAAFWDGRDSAGALVKAGTYSWTVRVDAADATGAAVSVDGAGPPTGTLTVTR